MGNNLVKTRGIMTLQAPLGQISRSRMHNTVVS